MPAVVGCNTAVVVGHNTVVVVGDRAMIGDRVIVGYKESWSGCPSLGCSLAVAQYCSKADQEVGHS